jgi:hypothetical protein
MGRRETLIWLAALLMFMLPLLVACGPGGKEGEVTIVCEGCESVQLWETSLQGQPVGEVKPGDAGIASEKVWNPIVGCNFYYVAVADQEGWVCEKNLEFK